MTTSIFSTSDFTIELSRQMMRVESLYGHHELDPKWSYTDPAGHVHTTLDTLEWVVTSTYWCDSCCDEHDEGEYRCRLCAAVVEPSYVFKGPDVAFVPGLVEGKLRMADGRTFWLRGDEMKIPWVDGKPSPEWLARVTAREPEEWTPVFVNRP